MRRGAFAYDFTGTGIVSPMDKMRAQAMIRAGHDVRGFSIISFNLNAFLRTGRHDDIRVILCLWAVEPVKRNPQKFINNPAAGRKALCKRAQTLIGYISRRRDIVPSFVYNMQQEMFDQITSEMLKLCPPEHYADATEKRA